MAQRGPNFVRRRDLEAALKRAKDDDLLSLDHLAVLWGVVKTRFVNIRNDIEATIGWPKAEKGPKNTHLYPARDALQKMLDYEKRHDKAESDRRKQVDRILGRTGRGKEADDGYQMPVNEMAQLHRMATEIEERERKQRLYIPATEVAATCAEVFALFSEFCGDLDNRVDPNGELPGPVRARVRELGAELQLRIHREMKDMLSADAHAKPSDAAAHGGAPRRARRASPRR